MKRKLIIYLIVSGIAMLLLTSCTDTDSQSKEWEQLGFSQNEILTLKACKKFVEDSSFSIKENIDFNEVKIEPYDEKFDDMAHSIDDNKELEITEHTNVIFIGDTSGQDYLQLIADMDTNAVIGTIYRKDYEEIIQ